MITTRTTASVPDAARLTRERRIGALPVVEGDGVVWILTEADGWREGTWDVTR